MIKQTSRPSNTKMWLRKGDRSCLNMVGCFLVACLGKFFFFFFFISKATYLNSIEWDILFDIA